MKAKIASKVMPSGRDDRRMWTMGEQPITPVRMVFRDVIDLLVENHYPNGPGR